MNSSSASRARQGTARIGRLAVFVGMQLHAHFDAGFFQQAGRLQRIAAIVAGAGQDQYRGRGGGGRAQQLLRLLGDGGTGALHQGVRGQGRQRLLFDVADLGNGVERAHDRDRCALDEAGGWRAAGWAQVQVHLRGGGKAQRVILSELPSASAGTSLMKNQR
jgi:hypothetical protein